MILEFTLRQDFGRERYYPSNRAATALVDITGRKCLNHTELERLKYAGFEIKLAAIVSPKRGPDEF